MKLTWPICFLLVNATLHAAQRSPDQLPNIPEGQPFTFAVLGDNRGDDSGQQPPAFLQVLQAVDEQAPVLVLDTGDMIYGHTADEGRLREQWRLYGEAIHRLRAPMFHVPGNHDLWDEPSGRIYRELWGKTYYAVKYGNARFIGLDTESANGRLGEEQFQWLEQELEGCKERNVFVFLHRPLFPVDGAIGSSLDEFLSERDRIHWLFVKHRKGIRGVFAGHEHLYDFQERDGVPYYISGGGGAPLYMAPELGGFHHFLCVRVAGEQVDVELKRVCAPRRELQKPRPLAPGKLLESWEHGLFWYAWDHTATIELTPERVSNGRRALRLNFDPVQYAWPVLVLSPGTPWDLRDFDSLSLDVYVPELRGRSFFLSTSLQGTNKHEAPPIQLKPRWNTITTPLDAAWLPSAERRQVHSLEWSVSTEDHQARGYFVFDNFRATRRNPGKGSRTELLESWERPMLWRVFDETVRAEITQQGDHGENPGLQLHVDFSKCNRPVLFVQLNPPWDLTKLKSLVLQVDVPKSLPEDFKIALAFRAKDIEFVTPAQALQRGASQLRFDLGGNWLPQKARAAVEQVAFKLSSTNNSRSGDITFKKLSTGNDL